MPRQPLLSADPLGVAPFVAPVREGFLSRLFSITASSQRRLEDFLTEVLAEALNSLSSDVLLDTIRDFFFTGADATDGFARWRRLAEGKAHIYAVPQASVDIASFGFRKKPDIIIVGDDQPLAIIECKIGAGYTSRKVSRLRQPIPQLVAYGRYLSERGAAETALILITQYRDPPADFLTGNRFSTTLRSVRRWSDLHRVWTNSPGTGDGRPDHLFSSLFEFIKENQLTTSDVQATDFAAAGIYFRLQAHERGEVL